MITILFLFIYTHPSLTQVLNRTADGIFESIIGDIQELKRLNRPRGYSEQRLIEKNSLLNEVIAINNTHLRVKVPHEPTTTVKTPPITPIPSNNLNLTIDDLKVRMRKIHLNKLLERQTTPIPDFSKNEDDPAIITRRFEKIDKEVNMGKKPDLRQRYHHQETPWRLHWEKVRVMAMMSHFIYAARYKLPYAQMLRKKYNYHYRYKIGYCLALLRNLSQQQYLIFSSLFNYYKHYSNLMIHLKLYEKIVRLDVDIKDLTRHIRHLNYLRNMDEDPHYYDDSPEDHNKRPFGLTSQGNSVNPDTKD